MNVFERVKTGLKDWQQQTLVFHKFSEGEKRANEAYKNLRKMCEKLIKAYPQVLQEQSRGTVAGASEVIAIEMSSPSDPIQVDWIGIRDVRTGERLKLCGGFAMEGIQDKNGEIRYGLADLSRLSLYRERFLMVADYVNAPDMFSPVAAS